MTRVEASMVVACCHGMEMKGLADQTIASVIAEALTTLYPDFYVVVQRDGKFDIDVLISPWRMQ